jgi:hypothetical protein
MVMMLKSLILTRVSRVKITAYAWVSAIEMTKLAICIGLSFLSWEIMWELPGVWARDRDVVMRP